jgi:prephenate dehydratase
MQACNYLASWLRQGRRQALVVFSASPLAIGILGPDGTFSAEAGLEYCEKRELKTAVKWYDTIDKCFDGVDEGKVGIAIVPLLNSTSGAAWVNETLRKLRDNHARIYDEHVLLVRYHLAVSPGAGLGDISVVHSKDKALQQCNKTLTALLPGASLQEMNSTAAAACYVRDRAENYRAAVINRRAAELYSLEILRSDVQDEKENRTRFIVISKNDHEPTGNDKTTVMFEFRDVKRPSLLCEVLNELADRRISLSYIQSLPRDGKLDEFTFYCDLQGHRKEPLVAEALQAIGKNPHLRFWKVLGSYPSSQNLTSHITCTK